MNFRHLRYFVAASEHGSFRKASVALGVQESTISRRVRDMEDGLGSALFHRHSGGVCLTVAGQRLLSKAQKVLRYINEGAEIVDASGMLVHAGLINAHTHGHGGLARGQGDRWTLELLLAAGPWISGGSGSTSQLSITNPTGA